MTKTMISIRIYTLKNIEIKFTSTFELFIYLKEEEKDEEGKKCLYRPVVKQYKHRVDRFVDNIE